MQVVDLSMQVKHETVLTLSDFPVNHNFLFEADAFFIHLCSRKARIKLILLQTNQIHNQRVQCKSRLFVLT